MKVGRGIRRLAARPARHQAGEAVSSPARGDRAFTAVTMAVVAFVAAIAASASYQHQYELAIRYGQAHWVAAMLPFSVDGMIVGTAKKYRETFAALGAKLIGPPAAGLAALDAEAEIFEQSTRRLVHPDALEEALAGLGGWTLHQLRHSQLTHQYRERHQHPDAAGPLPTRLGQKPGTLRPARPGSRRPARRHKRSGRAASIPLNYPPWPGAKIHNLAAGARLVNGTPERADLGFGGHVRQSLGCPGDFHAELVAQVPEHFLEVGVVGPLAARVLGELPGLTALLTGTSRPRARRDGPCASAGQCRARL